MSDHGRFIWYELMTPDPAGSKTFYADLLGWDCDEMPGEGFTYTIVGPGVGIGGIMETPAQAKAMGIPPNWSAYVHVDDVDASAAKAQQLGGSALVPPTDIPNIGRFAVIADPQGAVISVMTPAPMETPPPSAKPGTPGTVGWCELYAGDLESAFTFYQEMFGWRKQRTMDMGPMGVYLIFGRDDGDVGGMMTKPETVPAPAWLYYFNVADIDASTAKVKAAGGKVLLEPIEVPGGVWAMQAVDPQGAMFALVGMRAA